LSYAEKAGLASFGMTKAAALAALGLAVCGTAAAEDDVPLPRPRPHIQAWVAPVTFREAAGPEFDTAEVTDKPTACDERLAKMAVMTPMPRLIGPGACGGSDMVVINIVLLPDGARVAVQPGALLNCPMAESFSNWLRDEAAPSLAKAGSPLRSVENYDSYECRSRNRIVGAKLSDHAHGDAIDVRSFQLADGRRLEPTDAKVDKALRDDLRESACHRFTTVLGPGSDGFHEGHIHLDLVQRRNGYRLCHWEVREPPTEVAAIQIDHVPLPPPRPPEAR
jgi:hypothetical protein